MNIDYIITEEINKFLEEEVISERRKGSKRDNDIEDILHGKKEIDFNKKKVKKKDLAGHKKKKEKKVKDIAKKGKKLTNGRRTDFNVKKERETNPNLNKQDSEDIADIIDSPLVNTAAVAHKMRPDLTPEGAQSELRKKVKGLKSDSGSRYKLKKKEAYKLNRILSKFLK